MRRSELVDKQLVEKANRMVQRQPTKPAEPGPKKYADFNEEINGREVIVTLHNGNTVRGRILDARRFWVKIITNEGVTLYVNKAYIAMIRPAVGGR